MRSKPLYPSSRWQDWKHSVPFIYCWYLRLGICLSVELSTGISCIRAILCHLTSISEPSTQVFVVAAVPAVDFSNLVKPSVYCCDSLWCTESNVLRELPKLHIFPCLLHHMVILQFSYSYLHNGVLVLKHYFAFAKTNFYSRFFSSIGDTAQKQSDQDAHFRHCNLRCLLDPSGYPLRHKPHNSWRLWHSQRSGHSKCTAWLLSKSTNVHPAQSTVQKEPGLLNLELDPTEELSNDRSQQGKELELTYLEKHPS